MKEREQIVDELLARGVGEFIDPDGAFRKKLIEQPEKVVIKFGVDVTRPDIHIGHAVVFRKLRRFQDLGCKVIFLIGDYTTMIGDPTGKSKVRPEIDQKQIEENMKTYLDQVGKILLLDEKVFSWIRNSDWFAGVTDISVQEGLKVNINVPETESKLSVDGNSFLGKAVIYDETRMQKTHLKNNIVHGVSLSRFLATLRHITHSRLIERDMFQLRLKNNQELYMHEMMYPVLQGIDSTVLASIYGSCDLEVGGTDQMFNMLVGRDVMKMNSQPPQAVLGFELLVGLDGKEKMSKSLDNYIAITDTPANMYGKVLSIPDSVIANYFELCTYTTLDRIEEIKKEIAGGKVNPKDIKMELARQIVAEYHGEKNVKEAEEDFITKFQKKEIPDEIDEFKVEKETLLIDAVLANGLVESKGEFRRLLDEGAVTDLKTKEKISDPQIKIEQELTLKIGKKRFVKFTI
jgi:tyrosyl-tRNA synthetase